MLRYAVSILFTSIILAAALCAEVTVDIQQSDNRILCTIQGNTTIRSHHDSSGSITIQSSSPLIVQNNTSSSQILLSPDKQRLSISPPKGYKRLQTQKISDHKGYKHIALLCTQPVEAPSLPQDTPADITPFSVLYKPTVIIDPGHGGHDIGVECQGVCEKDITLDVAIILAHKLKEIPFLNVVLTRHNDTFVSKNARALTAMQHYGSCYISLHTSKNPNPEIRGALIYHYQQPLPSFWHKTQTVQDRTEQLAFLMLDHIKERVLLYQNEPSSLPDKQNSALPCPSVYISLGHISNTHERSILTNKNYQHAIAESIAAAIQTYMKY